MWNLEPAAVGALRADPMAPEKQEVQIDFARSPVLARFSAEGHLQLLQRGEERKGACLGVRPRRNVEGHDGVKEIRLVRQADWARSVKAR
jgi:hypothetical protein